MSRMKFIHYGNTVFDSDKFKPIKNVNFVKPSGGFWASPLNSKRGWNTWCEENEFGDYCGKPS